MPSTIVATPGASNANSYATVAEADTYFDDRLKATAWTGADADDKARALIEATRRIDQEEFEGTPVDPLNDADVTGDTQALKWPRQAADDDAGWTYDDDVIPTIVKRATFELALALLDADSDFLADTGLEGFKRVAVGSLQVTPRHTHRPGELPETVRRILRPVLRTSRHGVRLLRA